MTVITEAFSNASRIRAKVLGISQHPRVIVEHPLASKTEPQVIDMAQRFVDTIAGGLVKA